MNAITSMAALLATAVLVPAVPGGSFAAEAGCTASANLQRLACEYDLRDDFYTAAAHCRDAANPDPLCVDGAAAEFDDGIEECNDVSAARLEVCDALNDATHEPGFGPAFAASFVDPLEIGVTIDPNPWFALVPGNRWVYTGGTETIEVVVTGDTKLINGVTCIVVVDTAMDDGEVVEITNDWYAQDLDGNVWYCGEIAENYETFDGDDTAGPELVDIDGSWKAGRDSAEAGLLLPFNPQPGELIRQEFAQGDAEDLIEIMAVDASEASAGASCDGICLLTRDFTPLEPGAEEHKYYAPGVGLIVEIDPATGDRVELSSFEGVGQ